MARRRSIFDDRNARSPKSAQAPEPKAPLKTMPPIDWDYDTPKPAMQKASLPPTPPAPEPDAAVAVKTPTPKHTPTPRSALPPLLVAAVGGAMLAIGITGILLASAWLRPDIAVGALGF